MTLLPGCCVTCARKYGEHALGRARRVESFHRRELLLPQALIFLLLKKKKKNNPRRLHASTSRSCHVSGPSHASVTTALGSRSMTQTLMARFWTPGQLCGEDSSLGHSPVPGLCSELSAPKEGHEDCHLAFPLQVEYPLPRGTTSRVFLILECCRFWNIGIDFTRRTFEI